MTGTKNIRWTAEIVNGQCPTCSEITMLVGITKEYYRCMNCGADLHQYVNGKISYLPVIIPPDVAKHFVRDCQE